jgi:hypothetical protein
MFVAKKQLILVEAKRISFTGRDGTVDKIKYTFLQADGNLMQAYEELPGSYLKEVQEVDGWDEKKAKSYSFRATVYQGKTEFKLLPKTK